jgi:hypothetical protein
MKTRLVSAGGAVRKTGLASPVAMRSTLKSCAAAVVVAPNAVRSEAVVKRIDGVFVRMWRAHSSVRLRTH